MSYALVANTSRATAGTSASIDTTGANILIAAVSWTTATLSGPVITDSKSNVWSPLCRSIGQSSAALAIWVAYNPTVGSGHTFTITGSTSSAAFAAFSGASTEFVYEAEKESSTGGATSLAAGSLTPSAANCLVITALSNRVNTTYSVDSGFTITNQIAFNSGARVGVALAYLIQTSAAAANPSWSWTGSGVAGALNTYFQPTFTPPASSGGGGAFGFAG